MLAAIKKKDILILSETKLLDFIIRTWAKQKKFREKTILSLYFFCILLCGSWMHQSNAQKPRNRRKLLFYIQKFKKTPCKLAAYTSK